jgi:large subunit ribosomal protein L14e
VDIPRGCSSKAVAKALEKAKFADLWAASSYAKKLEVRQKRASTTDFDRFKLMLAKKKV